MPPGDIRQTPRELPLAVDRSACAKRKKLPEIFPGVFAVLEFIFLRLLLSALLYGLLPCLLNLFLH